jgi:hypothetical protein
LNAAKRNLLAPFTTPAARLMANPTYTNQNKNKEKEKNNYYGKEEIDVSNVQEYDRFYGTPIAEASYTDDNTPNTYAEVVGNDGYNYPYDL